MDNPDECMHASSDDIKPQLLPFADNGEFYGLPQPQLFTENNATTVDQKPRINPFTEEISAVPSQPVTGHDHLHHWNLEGTYHQSGMGYQGPNYGREFMAPSTVLVVMQDPSSQRVNDFAPATLVPMQASAAHLPFMPGSEFALPLRLWQPVPSPIGAGPQQTYPARGELPPRALLRLREKSDNSDLPKGPKPKKKKPWNFPAIVDDGITKTGSNAMPLGPVVRKREHAQSEDYEERRKVSRSDQDLFARRRSDYYPPIGKSTDRHRLNPAAAAAAADDDGRAEPRRRTGVSGAADGSRLVARQHAILHGAGDTYTPPYSMLRQPALDAFDHARHRHHDRSPPHERASSAPMTTDPDPNRRSGNGNGDGTVSVVSEAGDRPHPVVPATSSSTYPDPPPTPTRTALARVSLELKTAHRSINTQVSELADAWERDPQLQASSEAAELQALRTGIERASQDLGSAVELLRTLQARYSARTDDDDAGIR